jgi:hypothetical protein
MALMEEVNSLREVALPTRARSYPPNCAVPRIEANFWAKHLMISSQTFTPRRPFLLPRTNSSGHSRYTQWSRSQSPTSSASSASKYKQVKAISVAKPCSTKSPNYKRQRRNSSKSCGRFCGRFPRRKWCKDSQTASTGLKITNTWLSLAPSQGRSRGFESRFPLS